MEKREGKRRGKGLKEGAGEAVLQRKWCVLYRSAMKIQLSLYDASSCNCYYFTCKHVCNTCINVRGFPYLVDFICMCFTHARMHSLSIQLRFVSFLGWVFSKSHACMLAPSSM